MGGFRLRDRDSQICSLLVVSLLSSPLSPRCLSHAYCIFMTTLTIQLKGKRAMDTTHLR